MTLKNTIGLTEMLFIISPALQFIILRETFLKSSIFLIALLAFAFFGCTTKELVSTEKMKKTDRLYVGKVFVDFNGQTNAEGKSAPRCDLFLKSSVTAEFKASPTGFVSFKENAKSVRLGEIACIFEYGNEKAWVHYPISFKSIPKSAQMNEVTYFGDVHIKWTLTPEEFNSTEYKEGFAMDKKVFEKGEFTVEVKDNFEASKQKFTEAYPDFKEASLRKAIFEIDVE